MRKTLLLTTVLLALSAWVCAQQAPSSQSSPSTSQGTASQAPNSQTPPSSGQGAQSAAGQNMVQGCLGSSGNNYTVTDKGGTSYMLQLPQGADGNALKPHVGEEVRVEGTTSSGGSSASGGASGAGQPSITVKNIFRVSTTCSNKSGAAPKQ
ncbi:MAG TPA: hypothetical protein VET69_14710 [Terriglobales bacterium]|nr:hypothetical protein [Terriglobales bacterium]